MTGEKIRDNSKNQGYFKKSGIIQKVRDNSKKVRDNLKKSGIFYKKLWNFVEKALGICEIGSNFA